MLNKFKLSVLMLALSASSVACNNESNSELIEPELTSEDAAIFVLEAQQELQNLQLRSAQASWVYQTYINTDTAALSAYMSEKHSSLSTKLAKQAANFNALDVAEDTRRKLDLMRYSLVLPTPADPLKSARLSQISSDLEGMYGSGEYCRTESDCMGLTDMSNIMATSRDESLLLEMWQGWRTVSPPMKALYEEQVS
jgi:peptidyl-dipeptidase A